MKRLLMAKAAWIVAALAISMSSAHADVIYSWRTLSATLHGQPTDLTASGEVTLTDAGITQGFGQVSSILLGGTIVHTLNGLLSASFEMFGGPTYTLSNSLVNFTATVHGQFLDVTTNNPFGGFFVNSTDSDAYYAVPGPGADELTVGYGSENPRSVCFGSQIPGRSACVVTGVFEQVPEPGSVTLFGMALAVLGLIGWRRRKDM